MDEAGTRRELSRGEAFQQAAGEPIGSPGEGPQGVLDLLARLRAGLPALLASPRATPERLRLLGTPPGGPPDLLLASPDYFEPPARVSQEQVLRAARSWQSLWQVRPGERLLPAASVSEPPGLAFLGLALVSGACLCLAPRGLASRRAAALLAPTRVRTDAATLKSRRSLLLRMLRDLPGGLGRLLEASASHRLGGVLWRPLARRVRARLGPRMEGQVVFDEPVPGAVLDLFSRLGMPVLPMLASPAWGGPFAVSGAAGLEPLPGVRLILDEAQEIRAAWDGEAREVATGWQGERVPGGLAARGPSRDVLVLQDGQPRHPGRLELLLARDEAVAAVVVCGNGLPEPVALVVPRRDRLEAWAGQEGLQASDPGLLAHPLCRSWMASRLESAQVSLPEKRRVRCFRLVEDDPLLHQGPGRAWRRRVEATLIAARGGVEADPAKDPDTSQR